MRKPFIAAASLAALVVAGAAAGLAVAEIAPSPPIAPVVASFIKGGYLPEGALDTLRVLPPAPKPGDYRYEADHRAFRDTRALKDTPRWTLAVADAEDNVAAMMRDFSCAAGVALTRENAPRAAALIDRMRFDVRNAVNPPKDFYKRQRPYLIDQGDICVAKDESLAKSPDYPSGHTTWGWTIGLVLAEAVPDRSQDILVRARAFGESRVVCGVHNASAIEAGRTNASILVATLHGSPEFRDDLAAARAEIAALRKAKAPAPQACDAEAALIAKTPY